MLGALLTLLLSSTTPPSVLVMPLRAEVGVAQGITNVLSEAVLDEVRGSEAFSRVTSMREVEAMAQMEQQRQVMNCSTESCLAELAGALGMELVLIGSVGKIGNTLVLSLRLVESRGARILASLTHHLCEGSEEVLLALMKPATRALLFSAHLAKSSSTMLAPRGSCAEPEAVAAPPARSRPARLPIVGIGAALVVAAVPVLLLGIVGMGATVGTFVAPRVAYIPIHEALAHPADREMFWNALAVTMSLGTILVVTGGVLLGIVGAGVAGVGATVGE